MEYLNSMKVLALVAASVLFTGCVSMSDHRSRVADPNERLDQVMALYLEKDRNGDSCHEIKRAYSAIHDCERIQREVERLVVEFPNNERILMANAVLQLEAGKRDKAQLSLDQLLSMPGAHPEAAILRSQLAVQEGNTARARKLLQQQIVLRPDYAELRETLAAVYYLEGKYAQARNALSAAGRLGASGWRIAYHEGLIREATQDWDGACQMYINATDQKPDFVQAMSRLVGLTEHQECRRVADRR